MLNSGIFTSHFLDNLNAVTPLDMCLAIVLSFLVGWFICAVYRLAFQGVAYSPSFGFTLIALTAITTVLMLAVTSNVMLSLGMVGALSIVRFRAAIKDPMEIAFLFWAIEAGIVLAAGIFLLGIVGNAAIGVFFALISRFRARRGLYLLVVRCPDVGSYREAKRMARTYSASFDEKSLTPRYDPESGELLEIEGDWEVTFKDWTKEKSKGGNSVEAANASGASAKPESVSQEEYLMAKLMEKRIKASLVRYNGSYTI